MNDLNKQFKPLIDQCMLSDRFRFTKKLKFISKEKNPEKALENLEQQIIKSSQLAEARASAKPIPSFPTNLPVNERQDDISKAIEEHQVIILCGETGSGKTTQLPKLCLKMGRGTFGMIGHTQPRRIAARSVATRIAEELKTEIGESVGYKIRFADKLSKHSHIKVMTDGILLAEIQNDPFLQSYDTLIIDEAHERSLNIDFILGYLKQLLPKRPDLKIIITSATIDPERFAKHFEDAPIIEVSGRTYPVEVRYRPLNSDEESESKKDQQQAILNAVDELSHESNGDVLVFLSGERQIRETAEALRKHHPDKTEIIPLYSRLSNAEQQKVFKSHAYRRIILATNVAETSLTIPGIQYVIDTGYARISRYSYKTKVQRLPIEKISQASANQRKGRCGRTSDGICIRLYEEDDFNNRSVFTDPEILRTNLASVILQMHNIRLGHIEKFPFIDKPDSRLIKDGYQLLEELQAMNKQIITPLGKILSRFPIDPRYARMIIAANEFSSLNEILVIVSALSIPDPRERPMDKQQAADQAHSQYKDEKSDFIAYLNLWNFYQEQRQHLTQNKLRKLCKKSFLSYTRMLEWRDIHSQLLNQCNDVGFNKNTTKINTTVAGYDAIHQSILSGLLSHAGLKNEDGEYQGARNSVFSIFPGSNLRKKRPQWIMAAEMLETQRHYGLTVAQIDPLWLEKQASHIIKKSYFEAHWEKRPAQIAAYEKSTLYGLVINPRKKINYGPIDPEFSRELYIRGAFVNREYSGHAAFFQHNEKLFTDIEKLEHQSRRQDVLVDDEVVYQFYDECIPAGIYNSKNFDTWRKEVEKNNAEILFLSRDYLMQHSAGDITEEQYPKQLIVNQTPLPLSYHFDPASEDDGVTLTVPITILNTLHPLQFEWLIPALLREKVAQLIKTLPKNLRKNFVPVPQFADACIEAINDRNSPLIYTISQQLTKMSGIKIPDDAWQVDSIDSHFFMRFDVRDENNKCIAHSRNLSELQNTLSSEVSEQFSKNIQWDIEQNNLTEWEFGKLPEVINKTLNGINVKGFPAIQDDDNSVSIVVVDTQTQSQEIHHDGLKRLYLLSISQQVKYLHKNLPNIQKTCMNYASIGGCNDLKDAIIEACIEESFFSENISIRNKEAFENNLQLGSSELVNNANKICDILATIFDSFNNIRKHIKKNNKPNWLMSLGDIQSQLDHLIYEDFLYFTPIEHLKHYPRYLQAIQQRLDKLQQAAERDRQNTNSLSPYWAHFIELNDEYYEHPIFILYRWMLEEYRVSLFAQGLKTSMPISEKRLEKQWQEVKKITR